MLIEYKNKVVNLDNVIFYIKYVPENYYTIRFYSANRETTDFIFKDQKSWEYCYDRIKQLSTCVTFRDDLPPEDITKSVDININNEKI